MDQASEAVEANEEDSGGLEVENVGKSERVQNRNGRSRKRENDMDDASKKKSEDGWQGDASK